MTVSSSDITNYANEFSSVDSDKITLFVNYASLSINQDIWDEKVDFAKVLLTCHYLKLDSLSIASATAGSTGPIANEKVGDLSRAYGTFPPGGNDESLSTTVYGSLFMSLRKSLLFTPMVVTGS